MDTGARVRDIRTKLGMNQEQFAKFVGIRREEVSRLETGSLKAKSIVTLRKFAAALGVSLDEIDRLLHGPQEEQAMEAA